MRTVNQKYLQNVHFYGFLNDAVTTWKYLASKLKENLDKYVELLDDYNIEN